MAKKINIKGVIIPNDYKWFYDWFEMDSTCPRDVETALDEANGDAVEVYVNSPGGSVYAGSEIYTLLKAYSGDVKIFIVGVAGSAASYISMASYCEMSPTSLMMIHCSMTIGAGNHNDFEHTAEVLRTVDEAIATAYMLKSGMSKEEVIAMMEHETWFTAEQAKEKGLIDAIMFVFDEEKPLQLVASTFVSLPTPEQLAKVKKIIEGQAQSTDNTEAALSIQKAKSRLSLLKMRGEVR